MNKAENLRQLRTEHGLLTSCVLAVALIETIVNHTVADCEPEYDATHSIVLLMNEFTQSVCCHPVAAFLGQKIREPPQLIMMMGFHCSSSSG